jgi:ribokinase
MAKIAVAGLLNIETTVAVAGFPIAYQPVNFPFWGVRTTLSGVGFNVAKALHSLGHQVDLLGLVGADSLGCSALGWLQEADLSPQHVLTLLQASPQSAILYAPNGQRQIFVDLKDAQETIYPPEQAQAVLSQCDLAVLCNINFARPMLKEATRLGKLIATDVHTISDLDDPYNRDFMTYAHILAMSHEALPTTPEAWATQLQARYGTAIILIGLGAEGALLAVRQDHFMERIPAVYTRPVVNTIGAGDAFFSAFLAIYLEHHDPYQAVRHASVFASYKVGGNGGADGFLTRPDLTTWMTQPYA